MSSRIKNEEIKKELLQSVEAFHLPRYKDLPDVGLYLDQLVRYVNRYFTLCEDYEITPSMVSNYVKHKLIPGPQKKCYGKESIAYLICVAYLKMVSSLDDIRMMGEIQRESYDIPVSYDYFCEELENMLQVIYGMKESPDVVGGKHTLEKELLQSAIQAVSHKIYLDHYFRLLRKHIFE